MSHEKGQFRESPKSKKKNGQSATAKGHSTSNPLLSPGSKQKPKLQSTPEISKNEVAWDILESLIGTYDGPEDWSEEHDHYLYGSPKKESNEKLLND